jgi:hypothetical protein
MTASINRVTVQINVRTSIILVNLLLASLSMTRCFWFVILFFLLKAFRNFTHEIKLIQQSVSTGKTNSKNTIMTEYNLNHRVFPMSVKVQYPMVSEDELDALFIWRPIGIGEIHMIGTKKQVMRMTLKQKQTKNLHF